VSSSAGDAAGRGTARRVSVRPGTSRMGTSRMGKFRMGKFRVGTSRMGTFRSFHEPREPEGRLGVHGSRAPGAEREEHDDPAGEREEGGAA
jgi:hypothetical protein